MILLAVLTTLVYFLCYLLMLTFICIVLNLLNNNYINVI